MWVAGNLFSPSGEKRGSSVAEFEVIPLPSGTAGHLIPTPLPNMWFLAAKAPASHAGFHYAFAPWHLGASWPSALCEVGLPCGQGWHLLGTCEVGTCPRPAPSGLPRSDPGQLPALLGLSTERSSAERQMFSISHRQSSEE